LALAEENLRRTTVQYEFGLISRNALRTVEQNITRINNEITDRQTELYTARQSLNHFLGLPFSQQITIEFEHALPEIPEYLDEHIAEMLPLFPNIIRLQHEVDRTGAERRAYRGSNRETRNTLQATYDRAQLELSQAKMERETSIRRSFNNLETQLRRKENLYTALELAVEAVALARSNVVSGRATQFDVDTALLAVFNAELDLQRAYNALWIQAFVFAHPLLFN
jgi:outer membrane protein TolC